MPAFEYRQAEEVRDALQRHGVEYLFIGKSGAILLGFPDTTQDADRRHVDVEGFPVCHPDDIIASKDTASSLPRLKAFREYWIKKSATG
jgi:hypothetical protein